MRRYPAELVVPQLHQALQSPHRGVRYWNAQLAADFPHESLVPDLARLLHEGLLGEDNDMRWAAATALTEMTSPDAIMVLQSHLRREADPEIREMILDHLNEHGNS